MVEATKKVPETLTLMQVRDNIEGKSEVWVLNETHKNKALNKNNYGGQLLFNVYSNNEQIQVVIPRTWIPINLMEFVPNREALLSSSQLASFYRKKYIRFISDWHAREILGEEDSLVEMDRVQTEQARRITLEDISEPNQGKSTNTVNPGILNNVDANPKIVQIMNNADLRPQEIVSQIRTNLHVLELKDCQYILEKAGDNERLKTLITGRMKELA